VFYDKAKLSEAEFEDFITNHMKFIEDYEKWKELVIDGVTPVLNDWRAKIPDLKAEKLRIAAIKDEEQRKKSELESQKRAQEEADRKKAEFEKAKADANKQIEEEADMNRMHNAFQQQATTQELGHVGPVKYVLRFTDDKQVGKPLFNVMYHCFLSPKFPGIYKLDKSKNPVVNEQGQKVYIDAIQYWMDFFVANCDAQVPGTEVKEVAKVIVRK
jgi:hypothetical protein